jgi:DNA-binding response OmpR family regulator
MPVSSVFSFLCHSAHFTVKSAAIYPCLKPQTRERRINYRTTHKSQKDMLCASQRGKVMKKILIVEDDSLLNKTLSYSLESNGYNVASVTTATNAKQLFMANEYHLYVLDVNLPDGNGFDLCRMIKAQHENAAIIFLTANDMESDMIKGFELGADDYVTKPFPISVFQKKVAALLNRVTKQSDSDIFDDDNLRVDFSAMSASVAGKSINLTPTEYRTLNVFVKNSKIVLTRNVLLEKLWDIDGDFVDEHTLTSTISRIRRKIETSEHQYIKTVYGMGYMWIGGVKQ